MDCLIAGVGTCLSGHTLGFMEGSWSKEAPQSGVETWSLNRSTFCLEAASKKKINSLIWVANRKGSFHIYIKTIL